MLQLREIAAAIKTAIASLLPNFWTHSECVGLDDVAYLLGQLACRFGLWPE